jgi:signal recognition particle subunit SRP54
MGSVRDLMSQIPGLNQMSTDLGGIDADSEIKRIQGIIDSMTPLERKRPDLIDTSRRRRIAAGAGVDPADVSGLVKQFDAMAAFVRQMAQMSMFDKIRALTGLGRAAASNPGARLFAPKVGTGKRLSPKEREKLRKQIEGVLREVSASFPDSFEGCAIQIAQWVDTQNVNSILPEEVASE